MADNLLDVSLPTYTAAQIAQANAWQQALAHIVWHAGDNEVYWRVCDTPIESPWKATVVVLGSEMELALSGELVRELLGHYGLNATTASPDAIALWCATVARELFPQLQITRLVPEDGVATATLCAYEFLGDAPLPWYIGIANATIAPAKLIADMGDFMTNSLMANNGHWQIGLPLVCAKQEFAADTVAALQLGDVLLLEH